MNGAAPEVVPPPGSPGGNQQWVGHGVAVTKVDGDVHFSLSVDRDSGTDFVPPPGFREGAYPEAEVSAYLRGFVPPPSLSRCRSLLDGRVLLLRAERGTGARTAAFALLAERHGAGGITGLDPSENPANWSPAAARGYLLLGLSPEAADRLGEAALMALRNRLEQASAHLVILVDSGVRLREDSADRQATHLPPRPYEVAVARLRALAEDGDLTSAGLSTALAHLDTPEFGEFLRDRRLPGVAVDLADELCEAVISEQPGATALERLRQGSDTEARKALHQARHSADSLALMASVALLEDQDRTVVEQLAAKLRPWLGERARFSDGMAVAPAALAAPASGVPRRPGEPDEHGRPDLLRPSLEERLQRVAARSLPPRLVPARRGRHRVRSVVFDGRHRSEAVLREMWLEHEGLGEDLLRGLEGLNYRPGADLSAGRAVGRVLAQATGPVPLGCLRGFAASKLRWQRRLVAYALGEVAQDPELAAATHEQLREWSRLSSVDVRCTVAETCAGSYGLTRPAAALRLLDTVLDGPDPNGPEPNGTDGSPASPGEAAPDEAAPDEASAGEARRLRTAVSFALGVLLTEEANHRLVLDQVAAWLTAEDGTLRHAYAVHVVRALSLSTFPEPNRPGRRKLSLADVLGALPETGLHLVVTALDDPATFPATAEGLAVIEATPELSAHAALRSFLTALAPTATEHRGVTRFLLNRYRNLNTTSPRPPEGSAR